MGASNHKFKQGKEVTVDATKANIRLDNVATDLSTAEKDAFKQKTGVSDTTYSVFTDTQNGLVPASNNTDEVTYGVAITSPAEGTELTAGESTTFGVSLPAAQTINGRKRLVDESPYWVVDSENREEKYINASAIPEYTLKKEDKYRFLSIRYGDIKLKIPKDIFDNGDVIKGYCYTGNADISSDLSYFSYPYGKIPRAIGYFEIVIGSTDTDTPNAEASLLYGDLINNKTLISSPDGNVWELEVDNAGNITTTDSIVIP
jgi:hypothetical protein